MKFDRANTETEVLDVLEDALESEGYPNPDGKAFVDYREYDRSTRMLFLWVTTLFTHEEWRYLTDYMKENLNNKTVVAIIRSDYHFDLSAG